MKSILLMTFAALAPLTSTPTVDIAAVPDPHIEISTDGGANWTFVTGAGAAIGNAFQSVTATTEHYGVVLTIPSDDGTPPPDDGVITETIYRVSADHIGQSQMTFDNTFGTRNQLTLTWDGLGQFVSVQ